MMWGIVFANIPELAMAGTWTGVIFWLGRRYERQGMRGLLFWVRQTA